MARQLRSDAARRRQRILKAAEICFAERGMDVPLEEICSAAEVGRATLYRNFENRTALVQAILSDNVDKLQAMIEEVEHRIDGMECYLSEVLKQLVSIGSVQHLQREDPVFDTELSGRYHLQLRRLIDGAHALGILRLDATPEMLALAVNMMAGGLQGRSLSDRRTLAPLVLDLCLRSLSPSDTRDPLAL